MKQTSSESFTRHFSWVLHKNQMIWDLHSKIKYEFYKLLHVGLDETKKVVETLF